MPFSKILDSQDLDFLTIVLNEHCTANGTADGKDRDAIARRIVKLFESGVSDPTDLKMALIVADPNFATIRRIKDGPPMTPDEQGIEDGRKKI